VGRNKKIIRIINLLVIFLTLLFFILGKTTTGTVLLVLFIISNTVRLVIEKSKTMDHFNERIYLFFFGVIMLFVILGARLWQIQVVKYDKFNSLSEGQSYGEYILKGKRGRILDATGRELAYDAEIYKVIIDPLRFYKLEDREAIIQELDSIHSITTKNFSEKLKENFENKRRYMVTIKKVDEIQKEAIDELKSKYHMRNNEIYFEHSTERKYYSYEELAPIVGFMGAFSKKENRRLGAYGIERYYDKYLKENEIEGKGYYTNFRTILPSFNKEREEIETDGNDVQLTIDYHMQYILDDEIKKQFEKVEPKTAVGIIMESSTGKILAMSSYPRTNNIAYLNNRAIRSQHEMGSIFKPIVMSEAYEEKIVDDNTILKNPDGYIMRYGHKIRDSDKHGIGEINPRTVIRVSSNVGMSLISEKIDPSTFEQYLRKYNLYEKTGIDTFGELAPRQLPHEKWDGMKKYTMSYGQGIAITPLQMIAALNTAINGGIYYKPYIVDNVKTPNGITIRKNVPIAKRRVISEETSKIMREMLQETAEKGTGRNALIEGYSIGGKTGTAQISSRGGYLKQEYLSSFIGIFPADKPKYTILIMFEQPKAVKYSKELKKMIPAHYTRKFGAWVAAPVFKATMERIIKYKGITPENVYVLKDSENVKGYTENIEIDTLPDFREKGVRLALMIANKYGIEISIDGKGKVVEQDPQPGTKLEDIKKIKIKLR